MINELMRRRAMLGAGDSLPYDAEIEYLEGVQGAYINTGFVVNSSNWRNIVFEYVGSLAGSTVSQWRVCGVGSPRPSFYMGMSNDHKLAYGKGVVNGDVRTGKTLTTTEYTSKHKYTYDYVNAVVYFDDTAYNMSLGSTSTINNEFYLFKWNGGTTFLVGGKLYEFRLYNNNVITLDMFPVRVGQVGYMYDRVSGQLFGNAGTGDFILGNDK